MIVKHLPLILTACGLLAGLAGQWYVLGYRLDAAEARIAEQAAKQEAQVLAEAQGRQEVVCLIARVHSLTYPGCP